MLVFSTHAFTEGDPAAYAAIGCSKNFNSRLHGRRPAGRFRGRRAGLFQLTPSRKATVMKILIQDIIYISTHAFTEGDD